MGDGCSFSPGVPSSSTSFANSVSQVAASWSNRLEDVLKDRTALDSFRDWMNENTPSASNSLDLHFALVAYANMCNDKNMKSFELAKRIYQKFLSLKSGTCLFIKEDARKEVGLRLKRSKEEDFDAKIFDSVKKPLDDYLRKLHDQFVHSDEFIDLFNDLCDEEEKSGDENTIYGGKSLNSAVFSCNPSTSFASPISRTKNNSMGVSLLGPPTFSPPSFNSSPIGVFPRLPGDASFQSPSFISSLTTPKSKEERVIYNQNMLLRMYPSPREPYVCHATTSLKQSAVSSTYSTTLSDHSNSRPARLLSIKEEHLKANTKTFTIPKKKAVTVNEEGNKYNHEEEEGRKLFANELMKKLEKLSISRKRKDDTKKQLKEITEQKGISGSLITSTRGAEEEEEDVDDYLSKMKVDSSGACSGNRSPRKSHRSPRGEVDVMSQSSHANYVTIGENNSFAPPPFKAVSTSFHHGVFAANQYDEMKSFGEMINNSFVRDRWSPYSKTKNNEGTSSSLYDSSGIESLATSDEPVKRGFESSPKRDLNISYHSNSSSKSKRKETGKQLLTISYKGLDGVPVVAHVNSSYGYITLREFKKHFSIPKNSSFQFFFKTQCFDVDEDISNGAPSYQLLLVKDESAILPLFNGRVSAEVRLLQH